MSVTFHTLASGSGGNSALLRADGFGVLIDVGLDERLIAHRLAAIGFGWRDVNAVLLTHAHSDHWTDLSLGQIRRLSVPFYCHPDHEPAINRYGGEFEPLRKAGLVFSFQQSIPFLLNPLITVTPIRVPHDSEPTFGFRIDGLTAAGQEWSVGYASDLGEVPEELFTAFREVDLLALEFNHDETMQRNSGRPRRLIQRVLGAAGHLSNTQATEAVRRLLMESPSPRLRHVVQLHLSKDCNKPLIAATTAQKMIDELKAPVRLTTASQNSPSATLTIVD
ncbi:MBL fold metallo-hydrolase [Zavarzinella formosa]|uniref:MBL fold metallo-hydrolase n=1 Tax=Zavarzinella formosa TaxID=360055 RepID=UPI0002E1450E|nr:MBL fold metallo-hydrolase [Zavarzinella formosa]